MRENVKEKPEDYEKMTILEKLDYNDQLVVITDSIAAFLFIAAQLAFGWFINKIGLTIDIMSYFN